MRQKILLKTSSNDEIRMGILDRISSEDVLIDIAKYDKNRYITETALYRVKTEGAFANIAIGAEAREIRRAAIEKVKNDDKIRNIEIIISITHNDIFKKHINFIKCKFYRKLCIHCI